jgi:hypothetical protein
MTSMVFTQVLSVLAGSRAGQKSQVTYYATLSAHTTEVPRSLAWNRLFFRNRVLKIALRKTMEGDVRSLPVPGTSLSLAGSQAMEGIWPMKIYEHRRFDTRG